MKLDKPKVATGEFLTGAVQWEAEDERRVHRIVLCLEWRTEGAGNVACGVPRSKVFRVRHGERKATLPFRFLVPYDGPVSFEGELISVEWKVRAQVDQKGFDEFGESGFRVEPRRDTRAKARINTDGL